MLACMGPQEIIAAAAYPCKGSSATTIQISTLRSIDDGPRHNSPVPGTGQLSKTKAYPCGKVKRSMRPESDTGQMQCHDPRHEPENQETQVSDPCGCGAF